MTGEGDLDRAVATATDHLLKARDRGGLWSDFRTEAGHSDEWVSGFVACALAQTGDVDDPIAVTLETLLGRQRKNGGWSYNRSIPADCDSTAWVLMALSLFPGQRPSVMERGLRFLRSHQDAARGGFCTYCASDGIHKVIGAPRESAIDGWLHSQPCVTGVALQTTLLLGQPAHSRMVDAAAAYLVRERRASGTWPSYWWKGYAYTTYHSLKALCKAGRLNKESANVTVRHLLVSQRPDGGWSDGGEDSEVFATAFCLLSLLLFPELGVLKAAASGMSWLMERQDANGAWPTSPILRIPAPMESKPEGMTADSWRVMQRGTGKIVTDWAAVYTSAAALWALSSYRRLYGNKNTSRWSDQ